MTIDWDEIKEDPDVAGWDEIERLARKRKEEWGCEAGGAKFRNETILAMCEGRRRLRALVEEAFREALAQAGTEYDGGMADAWWEQSSVRRALEEKIEGNPFEKACRIWLSGCSVSQHYGEGKDDPIDPADCPECTKAFLDHLRTLS